VVVTTVIRSFFGI